MLGKSHLLVGAAGFLAVGEPALHRFGVNPRPAEMLAGAVICAGAAMLPDLDHPQATVTKSLGPLTEIPSGFLSAFAGGHRNGTHSLLFAGLAGFGAFGLLGTMPAPWAALLLAFFFPALVIRVLTEARGVICAGLAMVISTAVVMAHVRPMVLAVSIGLGCLLHMIGDFVTPEGVPPLWPLSKMRFRFPIVGSTGDNIEKLLAGAAGLWALWAYLTVIAAPALIGHRINVNFSRLPLPHVHGGPLAMVALVVGGIALGIVAMQVAERIKHRGSRSAPAPAATATTAVVAPQTDGATDTSGVDIGAESWQTAGAEPQSAVALADDFIPRPDADHPPVVLADVAPPEDEFEDEFEVEEPQDWPWREEAERTSASTDLSALDLEDWPVADGPAVAPAPKDAAAEATDSAFAETPIVPPVQPLRPSVLDAEIAARLAAKPQIRFRPAG